MKVTVMIKSPYFKWRNEGYNIKLQLPKDKSRAIEEDPSKSPKKATQNTPPTKKTHAP